MDIIVSSIKKAKLDLEKVNINNIKAIIISSYNNDIEKIPVENKLVLNFDDITYTSLSSFSFSIAKKIHDFIDEINDKKYNLYICCDSGESRSSAIAACILRKNGEDENKIWKDYNYHPNILVYDILCKEFGLYNTKLRLKYKKYINDSALRKKIRKQRNSL